MLEGKPLVLLKEFLLGPGSGEWRLPRGLFLSDIAVEHALHTLYKRYILISHT